MNIKDTGGPAFPCEESTDFLVECKCGETVTFNDVAHPGMTLRDWFAGQALAGILAHQFSKMVANVPEPLRYDMAAIDAYVLADAMLKERSK